MIDLYYRFFEDKEDLEASFKELGAKFGISVESRLKAIKDESEFLAAIIELKFGILFSSIGLNLRYEIKPFPDSHLTPDWTIETKSQTIIAEVVRLNSSYKDKLEIAFSDSLIDCLGTIEEDVVFAIDYDYDAVKTLPIDFQAIKVAVSQWLEDNNRVGDSIRLYELIEVAITHRNVGVSKACSIGNFSAIKFDYRRLSSENSRLFEKLVKYAEEVERNDLSFIICIHLTFDSNFNVEDLHQRLYGSSVFFDLDRPYKDPAGWCYSPNSPFWNLETGLYYNNELFRKHLSGVMVDYQGEYTFLPNFNSSNRLSSENMLALKSYIHSELGN